MGILFKSENMLQLTLHEKAFTLMNAGIKKCEYRNISKWMNQRLFSKSGMIKPYNTVKFFHAYITPARPIRRYFIAKYLGFCIKANVYQKYSNGLEVSCSTPLYELRIGNILERGVQIFKQNKKLEEN